ncbi:hypothetical protein H310_12237 [Aphanomyces invadans]|uniref:Acyltransferase 3 domain-containing protein n=1 Tax=Aphanomyces invadans TaxID=157072 RepID=A0A024TKR5_9STRA|nr:hypothetical protein H310_12237 [Aphanomyces invadans]ETV93892.1 hypothetical protein H310_12237 [Aphanomyces invadans]|eukprot:XP_008877452.1 hypothetical protein H310_12237 [Aphanomyces invadans]
MHHRQRQNTPSSTAPTLTASERSLSSRSSSSTRTPHSIQGGFIGVDVFLVITGYLISGILFKENAKGTFMYAAFYSRRIRRIFPALLLVLTFTHGRRALRSMAATMMAGTLFSANLQLLTIEQGYFDASVKEKPLLHLWSLGVEEQFYIFWPLFVSIISRLSFRSALGCQLIVVVASFVCNILFLGFHGENKYSFYFPLSRFWQMAIGGLLAYVELPTLSGPSKLSSAALVPLPFASSICSVGGFAAIVTGYWFLLPTLGTACVIFTGPLPVINQYVLGNAVSLLYPRADLRPVYVQPYAMIVLSEVLSLATLYLVENNLRRRKAAWVVLVLFVLMVAVGVTAAVVFKMTATFSVKSKELASTHHAGDLALIEEVKPKVLFIVTNWVKFLRAGGLQDNGSSPPCCAPGYVDSCPNQSRKDVDTLVTLFEQEISAFVVSGIKSQCISGQGEACIRELVEKAIRNANATLVAFSENQCVDDVCHVVSMKEGEPVFKDNDHLRPYFARNYLTSVDQVVQAAWE